jgi:hypothetical protein
MLTFTNIHEYSNVVQLHSDERITGTGKIVMSKEVEDGRERGLLFVKATTHPKVFTYGLKQLGDGIYHGDGYVWSSRVGCLNIEFYEDFVEVHIDNCANYCMHRADLQELLPDDISLEKRVMFKEKEIYYYPIQKKS